jgi:septum formation protein
MLYLCSGSSTRAGLLRRYGVAFESKPVDFDEEALPFSRAEAFVYHAAKGKLEAAKERYGTSVPLLTADTVILAANGTILRKAADADDARRILSIQSGSEITIITSMHYLRNDLYLNDTSATRYRFAPFDRDDLEAYIRSGDWQGKAGACMVEGFCRPYIRDVHGRESTAMGLQVEVLLPWIGA